MRGKSIKKGSLILFFCVILIDVTHAQSNKFNCDSVLLPPVNAYRISIDQEVLMNKKQMDLQEPTCELFYEIKQKYENNIMNDTIIWHVSPYIIFIYPKK